MLYGKLSQLCDRMKSFKFSIHCLNYDGGCLRPELYIQQPAFSHLIDFLVPSPSEACVLINSDAPSTRPDMSANMLVDLLAPKCWARVGAGYGRRSEHQHQHIRTSGASRLICWPTHLKIQVRIVFEIDSTKMAALRNCKISIFAQPPFCLKSTFWIVICSNELEYQRPLF